VSRERANFVPAWTDSYDRAHDHRRSATRPPGIDLGRELPRGRGVTYLVATGCATRVCVDWTVRDAGFRDDACVVMEDCTAEPIGAGRDRTSHRRRSSERCSAGCRARPRRSTRSPGHRNARRGETTAVPPETRYARSGDVNIAYQVVGDGPFDLVFVPGYVTHLEVQWKFQTFAPFLEELASFSRLIRFDKRGTGMSDRVSGAPTLETRMDDVRAVMDATGSQRAAFYGLSEGAAMSILFAATYPERTAALVVRSAFPRSMRAHDYPWGRSDEEYEREVERALQAFGPREQALASVRALGEFTDQETDEFLEMIRFGASPGAVEALHRMNKEIDVRHVLPAVRVPTLILRGSEDRLVPAEVASYMATSMPSARVVEIPGPGHLAFGRYQDPILAEIRSFLTGIWESGGWEEQEPDRVLATVLFTDIVSSSARASALGDRGWRELLERHHGLVRRELLRFRGRELDTAGDGFLASFDGPARAIRCACAIVDSLRELDLEIRAGLHTGECELVDGKVAGIAVHTGARVAAHAQPGEVLVSSTVKDLVAGSGIRFADRGLHELAGVPGEWRLYAVEDPS
jgi:pimeloyl-ACP methyl ester carboxylesterase